MLCHPPHSSEVKLTSTQKRVADGRIGKLADLKKSIGEAEKTKREKVEKLMKEIEEEEYRQHKEYINTYDKLKAAEVAEDEKTRQKLMLLKAKNEKLLRESSRIEREIKEIEGQLEEPQAEEPGVTEVRERLERKENGRMGVSAEIGATTVLRTDVLNESTQPNGSRTLHDPKPLPPPMLPESRPVSIPVDQELAVGCR